MKFPNYNFSSLNEVDVREEIISPLLRELGYRSGTENDVIREQTLKYPCVSLGRKNSKNPELRGRADYICETKNKTRWVIEAKPPSEDINEDTKEQAWSYANHPEVRAVYFCICNGLKFLIFQTNKGPDVSAIFECTYGEMNDKFGSIENILSPDAILRDYPFYKPDYGEPLAPGLRSFASLTNGRIVYERNSLNVKPFEGMVMTIINGSVERNETAGIEAYIKIQAPFQKLQDLNEKLGLDELSLKTEDQKISTDINTPTTFYSRKNVILPGGARVLDLTQWVEAVLPIDISVSTETIAIGYMEGNVFHGSFLARLFYQELKTSIELDGTFTANVS